MGNVSGKYEEDEISGSKNEHDGEEFMEYAHSGSYQRQQESMVSYPSHNPSAYPSPLFLSPQVPLIPFGSSGETAGNKSIDFTEMHSEDWIPTMITWNHDGNHVAIEGSWDDWKTREFLQRNGKEFTIMKLLRSGVYRCRFVVDGNHRYDTDLPQEYDDAGNVLNILDLQDHVPEMVNNMYITETPLSPASSYNSIPFSLEDLQEKLPELPPQLQRTPLDQHAGERSEALEKPLPAVLNHLYIEKGHTGQSMVALGSTYRFRKKYVTTILYKSLRKPKK